MDEKEDIISLLPDNLLHRILSLLPTKDAVSTCLLSKRWQSLWTSTTNLDFDCPVCPRFKESKEVWNNKFVLFLSRVIHYHSSTITRFSLVNHDMTLDPTPWIFAAVQRQVQEVCLTLLPLPILFLPHCLCTSKNLTVLKVCTTSALHLPSVVRLSSLKILSLGSVKFLDFFSFVRLFSGLPVVEELKLDDCQWINIRNATISFPTLKRLMVNFSTSRFWRHDDFELKVNAENLLHLNCVSDRSTDLVLDNTPFLSDASINIRREHSEAPPAKLIGSLRSAKSLKLDQQSLESLYDYASPEKTNTLPGFVNLTHLEVTSTVYCTTADTVLTNIISNAPILRSLVIKKLYGQALYTIPLPRCIEFSLRECSLMRFKGGRRNMALVRFFLQKAKVLEKIKLYCTENLCNQQEKLEKVKQELKELSRLSNNCVIEFLKPLQKVTSDSNSAFESVGKTL